MKLCYYYKNTIKILSTYYPYQNTIKILSISIVLARYWTRRAADNTCDSAIFSRTSSTARPFLGTKILWKSMVVSWWKSRNDLKETLKKMHGYVWWLLNDVFKGLNPKLWSWLVMSHGVGSAISHMNPYGASKKCHIMSLMNHLNSRVFDSGDVGFSPRFHLAGCWKTWIVFFQ